MNKYLILLMTFICSVQKGFCEVEALSPDLSTSLKVHTAQHEPGIFSIVIALLVVICLIYVTGIIYSKLNVLGSNTVKKQLKNYDLTSAVVLSTTQLGQNRNLHVIEVGGERLLVGATQTSINLVKDLGSADNPVENKPEENKVEIVDDFDLHKKYL